MLIARQLVIGLGGSLKFFVSFCFRYFFTATCLRSRVDVVVAAAAALWLATKLNVVSSLKH